MRFKRTSQNFALTLIILGIIHSVYPIKPSALLKRSTLRKRLLEISSSLRPKRQLFREDIPHHRPLTGNTYYLHAGFPHPSRWHDGPQIIPPNPEPITHHHLHEQQGQLHDGHHNNNIHPHDDNFHPHHENLHPHNENLHPHHENLHPHNENLHPHHENPHPHNPHHDDHLHHNGPHLNLHHDGPHHHIHHHSHGGGEGGGPVAVNLVNNKPPHHVNIHSSIVHGNGVIGGGDGVIDNSLGPPIPPRAPIDQANFDPLLPSPPFESHIGGRRPKKKKPRRKYPKPHTEPDHYDEGFGTLEGDYEHPLKQVHHENHVVPLSPHSHPPPHPHPPPPHHIDPHSHPHPEKGPERKPKTIIHYHPITVGNIINFNDDHKPTNSYGPPNHVPGHPLSQDDVLHAISQPFIKSPYKSVDGPPDYLEFKDTQYGPPDHTPGPPLGPHDLSPMQPSYGPPVKDEPIPEYLPPVLAHLHHHQPPHHPPPPPPHHFHHHPLPHPPPPRRHRGGRVRHRHHHVHHFHHSHSPEHVEHPVHVVHGHVPHSPPFRSHSNHAYYHHKTFWSL